MTYRFSCVTVVDAPAALVFDLARDVDAHVATMGDSQERAVAGVTGGVLGLGDEVTWEAKHFGVTWRMTSRIAELDRPARFVDEQTSGPFAQFRHEHLFEARPGGVVMRDDVTFQAPLGPVGWLIGRLGLGAYMKHLICRRARALKELAEAWQPRDRGVPLHPLSDRCALGCARGTPSLDPRTRR